MHTRELFCAEFDELPVGKSPLDRCKSIIEYRDVSFVTKLAILSLRSMDDSSKRMSIDSLANRIGKHRYAQKRRLTRKRIISILTGLAADGVLIVNFGPDARRTASNHVERVWFSLNRDHFEVEAYAYRDIWDLIPARWR